MVFGVPSVSFLSFLLASNFYGEVTCPLSLKGKLDVREPYRIDFYKFLRENPCDDVGCREYRGFIWGGWANWRCQRALDDFNVLEDDEKSGCPGARRATCRWTDFTCVAWVPYTSEDDRKTKYRAVPLRVCAEKVKGFAQQARDFKALVATEKSGNKKY